LKRVTIVDLRVNERSSNGRIENADCGISYHRISDLNIHVDDLTDSNATAITNLVNQSFASGKFPAVN